MPNDGNGGWADRVAFSDRGFAYRPGEILVANLPDEPDRTRRQTEAFETLRSIRPRAEHDAGRAVLTSTHERYTEVDHAPDAADVLTSAGFPAQVNHVLFSHCMCCCGPHPAGFAGNPFAANPFAANPFAANPFAANPFAANPFAANPAWAYRFGDLTFQPNPMAIQQGFPSDRAAAEFRSTGRRRHGARPAAAPNLPRPPAPDTSGPVVTIVDTGIANPAGNFYPNALGTVVAEDTKGTRRTSALQEPDMNSEPGIDPVAGHGTFIAGIIRMIEPTCKLHVRGPLDSDGDISEDDLAIVLEALVAEPPRLLNLSVGGYAVTDMPRLRGAVLALQEAGTVIVASAGNDATCRPTYPAAFEDVVSVGALDAYGPAHFTNFGPWVRACAPGVDIVSTFFKDWQSPVDDDEKFDGWASWSGTSFATPAVVGALARAMTLGLDEQQAVERLIDDPALFRIPGLGAVVNQTLWWNPTAEPAPPRR